MLFCDLARVPLFAAIPILNSLGLLPFWMLMALVAASGVFIAPYLGVQRAVVPELVGEEHGDVASATALFQAANRLTIFLGPPLAGVLIAVVGAANILYVDAATYLVSFVLVGCSSIRPRSPRRRTAEARSTVPASSSATGSCGSGSPRSRCSTSAGWSSSPRCRCSW